MSDEGRASGSGRLSGRRIIVTGAASGIGRAIAELFREEGAELALVDRNAEGLAEVADALGAVIGLLDLEDEGAIAGVVDDAASRLGGLDGVVNCAGYGDGLPIGQVDSAVLAKVLAINLIGPFMLCRAALPYLRQASWGTIVNIASATALLPNSPNTAAYAAAKGGLVTFTKALAAEVAPNIRANSICPGVTNTPMAAPVLKDGAPWLAQYALRRAAEPVEMARAALFLTSGESSYITGTSIAVDGGRSFH